MRDFPTDPPSRSRRALALAAALALVAAAPVARGQELVPKRTLVLPAPGCLGAPPAAPRGARDDAEARRLAERGREAALVGDLAAARDAFRRAASLNPADERVAYDLARVHDELRDTTSALAEYCRYLALAPGGRQAGDVRARVVQLAPPAAAESARRAQARFAAALAAHDAGRHADAAAALDEVLRLAPTAPEALYNRAAARAALGRRAEAVSDLEAYLATVQAADERAAVARIIEALRRPMFDPGDALVRGLIAPGLGQFYTQRPGLGVAALGVAAAAVAGVAYERTETRDRTFIDAFGQPYTQGVPVSERPYAVPAAAVGAAVWIAAAVEARLYAARSRRGAERADAGSRHADGTGDRRLRVAPVLEPGGGAGLRLRATF